MCSEEERGKHIDYGGPFDRFIRHPPRVEGHPPSWKLADLVITAGIRGILFLSLRHAGGTILVIFPANLVEGDNITVHDPDHRLPQDQSSWP